MELLWRSLHESAETLSRDAQDLLRMKSVLTPAAQQLSLEIKWFMALLEDDIATTIKRAAYGERLLFGPNVDGQRDYESSDKDYWMAQKLKSW